MGIKKVPTKFETSDGQEFDTEKEAERHEALITAREKYEDARRQFGLLLAQTQKTADGQPFEFSLLREYYYVTPGWNGIPDLSRVSFSGWNFEFEDDDELVIRQQETRGRSTSEWYSYRISKLYADERVAKRALLKAREDWLAKWSKHVEELRAKLKAEGST